MKKLIFVYNADSSLFAGAKDYVTKIVSPATYGCRLCNLTFGAIGEKKEWKNFIKNLKFPSQFLHRDEFQKEYAQLKNTKPPAVFLKENGKVHLLISSKEINKQEDLNSLKNLVRQKVSNLESSD